MLSKLRHNKAYLDRESLIMRLQGKSYFTDDELNEIMRYRKVPHHTNQGSVNMTAKAFNAGSLEQKIKLLKKLNGVGMTVASTILMFNNPYKYVELNHEVWNLLQRNYGLSGSEKGGGSDYSLSELEKYIEVVMSLSEEYGMKPSDTLFTLSELNK
ncbi:MAG: hypothetical protein ABIH11_05320 [Candidatus Altiarchaeota archaeon]